MKTKKIRKCCREWLYRYWNPQAKLIPKFGTNDRSGFERRRRQMTNTRWRRPTLKKSTQKNNHTNNMDKKHNRKRQPRRRQTNYFRVVPIQGSFWWSNLLHHIWSDRSYPHVYIKRRVTRWDGQSIANYRNNQWNTVADIATITWADWSSISNPSQ